MCNDFTISLANLKHLGAHEEDSDYNRDRPTRIDKDPKVTAHNVRLRGLHDRTGLAMNLLPSFCNSKTASLA